MGSETVSTVPQITRMFVRDLVLSTTINIEFKAICPIPDPPRYYHGSLMLRYVSATVLDFNEVAEAVADFCSTGNKSVEDIVRFGIDLMRSALQEQGMTRVESVVAVPVQPGHLSVQVYAEWKAPK